MKTFEFEIRAWFKKGYGEKMVYLKANDLCRKVPSNAEISMIFMRPIGSNDCEGKKVFEGDNRLQQFQVRLGSFQRNHAFHKARIVVWLLH